MARAKIVSYDLNRPGKAYPELLEAIRPYPHAKVSDSCWVVGTPKSASAVYDELRAHVDANDTLFVGTLAHGAKWGKCADQDKIKSLIEKEW